MKGSLGTYLLSKIYFSISFIYLLAWDARCFKTCVMKEHNDERLSGNIFAK